MIITKQNLEKIILEEIYNAQVEILAENFLKKIASKVRDSKLVSLLTKSKEQIQQKIISKFKREPTLEEIARANKIARDYAYYLHQMGDKPEKVANLYSRMTKGVGIVTVTLAAIFIGVQVPDAFKSDVSLGTSIEASRKAYVQGSDYKGLDPRTDNEKKYDAMTREEIIDAINSLKRSVPADQKVKLSGRYNVKDISFKDAKTEDEYKQMIASLRKKDSLDSAKKHYQEKNPK